MYEELLNIRPRLIPTLRERSRNTGPEAPVATSSGYTFPSFIVMDKGESLRDFVAQSSDAEMAWLHALHALGVLAKQLKVCASNTHHNIHDESYACHSMNTAIFM
jgi:hypothetical protein